MPGGGGGKSLTCRGDKWTRSWAERHHQDGASEWEVLVGWAIVFAARPSVRRTETTIPIAARLKVSADSVGFVILALVDIQ